MAAHRFVFVHGAWHGAWCFDLFQLELQRRAVPCHAVDLPSLGDDTTPVESATFEAGVERVLGQIGTRKNITLVAHSLGAFYATEAAIRAGGRVRGIVYLASFVPKEGDTFVNLRELAPPPEELQAATSTNEEETALLIDADKAKDLFYEDVAEGIAVAAMTRLRPQPIQPFRSAAISDDAETLQRIKRRVIVAENDRVISPDHCVEMADRVGIEVESVPTGHCPFLSMPKLLADVLLGVS